MLLFLNPCQQKSRIQYGDYSTSYSPHKKSFQVLFAKLFLIVGLPWLLESIHYLVFSKETQIVEAVKSNSCKNDALEIVFRVGSGYNLLRGLFLLLIFGCKKEMWQRIKKRVGIKSESRKKKGASSATTRTSRMTFDVSTDSQHSPAPLPRGCSRHRSNSPALPPRGSLSPWFKYHQLWTKEVSVSNIHDRIKRFYCIHSLSEDCLLPWMHYAFLPFSSNPLFSLCTSYSARIQVIACLDTLKAFGCLLWHQLTELRTDTHLQIFCRKGGVASDITKLWFYNECWIMREH